MKMETCKWWHKLFTTWCGESKEEKTILSPDRPKYIMYWYNEYKCHICSKVYRVDVAHDMPKWSE